MLQPSPSTGVGARGSFFERTRRGIAARVRVSPGTHRDRIEGVVLDPDGRTRLRIAVRAAAEGGRANAAVIALLAEEWGLPKSQLAIVAGASHRRKTIGVAGDPVAVADELAAWASRRLCD
jgi:uncharacterized protein YggU (UPF0235/DUF167 family)